MANQKNRLSFTEKMELLHYLQNNDQMFADKKYSMADVLKLASVEIGRDVVKGIVYTLRSTQNDWKWHPIETTKSGMMGVNLIVRNQNLRIEALCALVAKLAYAAGEHEIGQDVEAILLDNKFNLVQKKSN